MSPHRKRLAEQVYAIALHDVRRMIETLHADEKLVSAIYRRLAKAVSEVHGIPDLLRYAKDAEELTRLLGDGPTDP